MIRPGSASCRNTRSNTARRKVALSRPRCTSPRRSTWARASCWMPSAAFSAPVASASPARSRATTALGSSSVAPTTPSPLIPGLGSPTTTRSTRWTFVRWARSPRRISAFRCASGSSRRPGRFVPPAPPAAISSSARARTGFIATSLGKTTR